MNANRWILDAAGVALLVVAGFASILIDARIGFPTLLKLLAGGGS